MKVVISTLLFCLAVNAKPYSKVINEIQEWGVIPQGLITDEMENIHLEDFYRPESLDFRSNAKKSSRNLSLGLSLPPNTSYVSDEEFYGQAVANLKAEMPQLRWVKLYDGYTYYVENGTSDQLENELVFLKQHLQRVMRILHSNSIDIEEQSQFHVNMLFFKDAVLKSRYREVLQQEYNYKVKDEDVSECMIRVRPQVGDFYLDIEINFVDRLSPFIRSAYPRNHSTRHETNEAIKQARISSRITGVLLSTFMGSPLPFFQCRI